MKRRDFNKVMLAGMAAGAAGPGILGDGQAYAQTPDGGLVSLLAPEPPTLILPLNQQQPTIVSGTKIYESLLDYDFDLTPKPRLAKSWDISDDGLTYTFYLQEKAKWHDGKPFTADDVVFSCDVMLKEVHARAVQFPALRKHHGGRAAYGGLQAEGALCAFHLCL